MPLRITIFPFVLSAELFWELCGAGVEVRSPGSLEIPKAGCMLNYFHFISHVHYDCCLSDCRI